MSEPSSDGADKIVLTDLHKAFGAKQVLKGVNLTIGQRESVVIVGGSGSGKSVTVKCILGLLEPDAGSIRIDGEETIGIGARERDRINRKIGMLFQGGALFDSLSVWENVAFGLMQGRKLARGPSRETAIAKLGLVGLGPEVAELMPAELSGGMQKRVALARAIATEPEIILFDEPTTGLDPIMADIINDLIVDCVRTVGASALTITHDMVSARRIADRIAMLYDGRIIWDGPVDRVDDSGSPHVDQFVNGRIEGPIQAIVG